MITLSVRELTSPIERHRGNSLVVQRLRLCASNAGGEGLILGRELRSHITYGVAKKRHRKEIDTRTNSSICCLQETHFGCRNTCRLKV